MKNFIFKSNASDLQKMFSILETLQKNMLYITYKTDAIIKIIKKLETDKDLQKQVDQYFEEGERAGLEDSRKDIPEE